MPWAVSGLVWRGTAGSFHHRLWLGQGEAFTGISQLPDFGEMTVILWLIHFLFLITLLLFNQEAMTQHVPDSSTVHIHVLSVHRHCRQQGKGSIILWRYLQYVSCMPGLRRALLICEDFLVPFYLKAGFKEIGPSAITVSNMHFQEMAYTLSGQAYSRRNSDC